MAVKEQQKIRNLEKFTNIKRRCLDMNESHAAQIKKNEFIRVAGSIFREMKYLVDEVERLAGSTVEIEPQVEVEQEDDELVEV